MRLALQSGDKLDMALVERFMVMNDAWEKSQAEKAYNAAFSRFKAEAVRVIKNRKVTEGLRHGFSRFHAREHRGISVGKFPDFEFQTRQPTRRKEVFRQLAHAIEEQFLGKGGTTEHAIGRVEIRVHGQMWLIS
jgi:hypothetical protein